MSRRSIIPLLLLLIWGCAGPATQLPPGQALPDPQFQSSKNKLQATLMEKGDQASLTSYRDYKVGPEDLLEISFFGNDELGREIRVNGSGDISLPLIGVVNVTEKSPQEIEEQLVSRYREGRFIRNPQISVFVKEYRHQRVMVTGAVANPGSYEMIGPRTLLEMLGKAGGLSDRGTEKAGELVYVIRRQTAPALTKALKDAKSQAFWPDREAAVVVDLRRLLLEGATELNLLIGNGDVIYVPPARMAYVMGAVKKPGQVAVKDNMTVTKALALTEGLDPMLASNWVTILRLDAEGQRLAIPVNLKEVTSGQNPDPPLKENDIVIVQESGFRRFLFDFKNLLPGSIGASVPLIP